MALLSQGPSASRGVRKLEWVSCSRVVNWMGGKQWLNAVRDGGEALVVTSIVITDHKIGSSPTKASFRQMLSWVPYSGLWPPSSLGIGGLCVGGRLFSRVISQSSRACSGGSRCGTTGLATPWECWDAGSIPHPAQWVKDLALCNCGSDLIPGPGTPYATRWPKKKKRACFMQNPRCDSPAVFALVELQSSRNEM